MAKDDYKMTRREMRAATVLAIIVLCCMCCVLVYKSCSQRNESTQEQMEVIVINEPAADSITANTSESKYWKTHKDRAKKKATRKSTYTPPPTRDHRNEPIN